MENQRKEKEITLAYLFEVLKKCVIFMVIAAVVFGAAAAAYGAFIEKPKYRATASFWVNNSSSQNESINQSQQYAAISLATSFIELANSDKLIRSAVEKYGLTEKFNFETDNDCVKALRGSVSAQKKDVESVVFYITVTAASPKVAYETIIAIQGVIPEVVQELQNLKSGTDAIVAISPVNSESDVQTVKTSPVKLAIIAALIAAVLVYVVFLVISIFDTSVYNESSITENFDCPIIGNIPSWNAPGTQGKSVVKRNKNGIMLRNYEDKLLNAKSPFNVTEAFNTVRTNVIFAAAAAKNPVFAVTSDVSGAGKTISAVNLAIALSNLNKKVLLVEADMRCPVFTKVFGKKVKAGLSELLAGMETGIDDVKVDVGYEGLDVIFGGKIPPNPSELLSSLRMTELVNSWRETYDYIVLDTPPIGEVFDAGGISSIVNGYIVTVRCNHSNVNEVKVALDRIGAVGGNVLGVIMNDVDPKSTQGKKKYYKSYRGYKAYGYARFAADGE